MKIPLPTHSIRWLLTLISVSLSILIASAVHSEDGVSSVPQLIPQPAEESEAPYMPQALLPGGIVIPLFPPDSSFLNSERVHEAEVYQMTEGVPGRVHNIVNIHNPSIEVHTVEPRANTGAAIILIPGGGHKRLMVSGEGTDFVSFFYNYGVNGIILRNRLRADGYVAEVDAVNDTLQAIRLVRSRADEWGIDPQKIGVMGSSAGGELASAAALFYENFDAANAEANDPLGNISSRPDFVGLLYPGPTPFTKDPDLDFPDDVPPVFIAGASYGEDRHTRWAIDYYMAMLNKKVPNIELHLYGNGGHGGGLKDRAGIPFGTWQDRYIDWFRDLGFLANSGTPTKAAADIESYLSER